MRMPAEIGRPLRGLEELADRVRDTFALWEQTLSAIQPAAASDAKNPTTSDNSRVRGIGGRLARNNRP